MTVQKIEPVAGASRLSRLLLKRVFVTVSGIGSAFFLALVILQVYLVKSDIHDQGQQLLAMFSVSAQHALQERDVTRAEQVVNGLLHYPALRSARLGYADAMPLAEQLRPVRYAGSRFLTDRLFGVEQHFYQEFEQPSGMSGVLAISLDTASHAAAFLRMAALQLVWLLAGLAGLLIVLYLVLERLLSRPLAKILGQMADIDPEHPGNHELNIDSGHRDNELGQWARQVNQLLRAIQHSNLKRQEAEASLQHLSHVDYLTGLPNRLGLSGKLEDILLDASSRSTGVAVMCIGLDAFKTINERYSFQLGDWLLRSFAQRVENQLCSDMEFFARLDGDQFILVHVGADNAYQAALQAQKLLFLLHQPFRIPRESGSDAVIHLSATIGITLFPSDEESGELLLQKAEQTMRLAKMGGHNRYQFYIASIDQQLRERRQLEQELEVALGRKQFHLVYQPQVCINSGKIVGAEALLRWRRANGEMVSPDVFIPLAEQTGTIVQIGEWVLEQACLQLRDWLDIGWQGFSLAVNLSAVQLHDPKLVAVTEQLLAENRIPADCLELEVTETCLMQDVETARERLLELRKLGVRIAIDDFGTGHSSLAYLKRLPLDKIKIDRSFVQEMEAGGNDVTIVRSVIQLSHSLQFKVLAEGVENQTIAQMLGELGCDEAQGYYYSRPVSADDMLEHYERLGA